MQKNWLLLILSMCPLIIQCSFTSKNDKPIKVFWWAVNILKLTGVQAACLSDNELLKLQEPSLVSSSADLVSPDDYNLAKSTLLWVRKDPRMLPAMEKIRTDPTRAANLEKKVDENLHRDALLKVLRVKRAQLRR